MADGHTNRLMIFMPPGSGKSRYATQLFPAWLFSRHPNVQFIGASHTSELAEDFSGRIHRTIAENEAMLGYGLRTEAKGRWYTTNGGGYLAAGVRGAIPGFRADGVVIDDPIKGRAAADSPTDRKAVWDWYNGDLERRLTPGAFIVLMHTRWHEDDLAGRLLATEGDRWRVLKLPAEAEADDPLGRAPGEWLWSDDDYGYGATLAEIKQGLSERSSVREWSSQYQQSPVPDTGDFFHRDWLCAASAPPSRASLRIYGASDYAVTAAGGDFTVHIVVGVDTEGRLWVLDLWRGRTSSDEWVEAFCDLVTKWKPIGWAEETGQIRSGVGPFLVKRMRERQAYVARQSFPTRGDKAIRAQSIRGRMAIDGLHYDAAAPWRSEFERELLTFPAGKTDDQVDALGLIGQVLDRMTQPQKEDRPEPLRGALEMTLTEAWLLARPRLDGGTRI